MTALTNNFNDSLIRFKKQIQTNRFLRWWLSELSAMVPRWMRSSDLTLEHYVLVPLEQISAQMRKPEVASPRVAAIALSAQHVLRKTIALPLATEQNLRQVLEFQMEQHTPFPPNKLYFGYSVVSRDFAAGQLRVEFVAVPRDAIDPAIKTLLALGVEVRAVFLQDQMSAGTLLNLLPAALGSAPSPLRHGANPWLAGLVVVLALAALIAPLAIKREAVVHLLPLVDKGKKGAEVVSTIRRELDERVKQNNYLLEKRQMSPAVVQILEEMTHILPDDTWVNQFELKDKKVTIQGETKSSSQLIGLFEKSSIFRDASYGSTTLFQGQTPGSQRYTLTIQLRAPATPVTPASAESSPTRSAAVTDAIAAASAVMAASAAHAAPAASAATPAASAVAPASGVKKP